MKGQGNSQEDCHAALCCLYEALFQFSRLMAPLAPFFAEFAYQQLRPLHPHYGDESIAADAPGAYARWPPLFCYAPCLRCAPPAHPAVGGANPHRRGGFGG